MGKGENMMERDYNEVLTYKGEDKLRVVVKEPLKEPEIRLIGKELADLQAVVEGHIEAIPFVDTNLCIYLNEEGKLKGLMPNLYLSHLGHIYDVVVGTVVVCKIDEEGNDVSLDQHECFQVILELERMAIRTEAEALLIKKQIEFMF